VVPNAPVNAANQPVVTETNGAPAVLQSDPAMPVAPQPGMQPPGVYSMQPLPFTDNPYGPTGQASTGYYRSTGLDPVITPRFIIDSRGGGLYGYGAGYSNIGVFAPYKLDDTSILFATGTGIVTYDGRGSGRLLRF
jgi:hypothetical protein